MSQPPSEPTDILIGIVTRDRASLLRQAIRSALGQTAPRIAVCVVDDGSRDETWKLRTAFPGVRFVRWTESRGYLEARNFMMSGATAQYFVSLDDDSWFVAGDEVQVAINHLDANPEVAAVAFDILSPDSSQSRERTPPRATHMFIGCGHVLRLAAVRAVGSYVENPGFYGGEEKDLCIRLLDNGCEIHLLPGVHVWHEKTMMARDLEAQHRSGVCNDLAFALRRCPMPSLLWVLPMKVLSHLRFAILHRRLRPCLRGIADSIGGIAKTWKSRRPVRAKTFSQFLQLSRA